MKLWGFLFHWCSACVPPAASAIEIVVATVNNGHMIEMQKLTPEFEKANPGIKLKWVTLEEGVRAPASPPTSPPRAASST